MKSSSPTDAATLRRRAKKKLASQGTAADAHLTPAQTQRLLHELHIHQIELEMQNEELREAQAQLEAAQSRYFDLYELASIGYCSLSPQGVIEEINLTGSVMLRVNREKLIGRTLQGFVVQEDQHIFARFTENLFIGGDAPPCELRMLRTDAAPLWVVLRGVIAQGADGPSQGRIVLTDITEKKWAEKALQHQHLMLRRTEHITHIGSWEWSLDHDQIQWSTELFHIFHRDPSKGPLSFAKPSELFVEGDMQRLVQAVNCCAAEGTEYELELRALREDRSIRHCLARGQAETDRQGQIFRLTGSLQDITARKSGEYYLELANKIFALQNGSSPFQTFIEKMLLVIKETMGVAAIGMRLGDGEDFPYLSQDGFSSDFIAHENSLFALDQQDRICRNADGSLKLECLCGLVVSGNTDPAIPLFTPGGSCWTNDSSHLPDLSVTIDPQFKPRNTCLHQGYLSVALVPIRNQKKIVGLLHLNDHQKNCFSLAMIEALEAVASEIAGVMLRKQAQEETIAIKAKLLQAQKMEAIGTLAGGIAHDFNNILGAILGYAEMIQEDSLAGSPLAHDIGQVLKAGMRAKELVKQILAFSRQADAQVIPVQPVTIIKEVIDLLRPSLPSTITIKQDIDRDAGIILADPTQMHQLIINLCGNAFHAMEKNGGTLTLTLQKRVMRAEDFRNNPNIVPGNFLQLAIEDTGEGIAPEILEKIFDPFFTTKEVGKGTGMGLATVYGIVASYGGFITCRSRLGEGTVFQVILPTLGEDALPESSFPQSAQPGSEHILLVDDEAMLLELAQAMLERLGYRVTTRVSSVEALATFQKEPQAFDMVITDQTMPALTGVDLARCLLQIRPELPIILCTGYSSLITEEKARSMGIKGFAMKPFIMRDIAALIRMIFAGKVGAGLEA